MYFKALSFNYSSTVTSSNPFLYLISYKYDGLIYTNINYPVGYDENNVWDYDTNTHRTWKSNLKWKPPEENTIDFLVKFEKDNVASYLHTEIRSEGMKVI